jgi:hypothetical protein
MLEILQLTRGSCRFAGFPSDQINAAGSGAACQNVRCNILWSVCAGDLTGPVSSGADQQPVGAALVTGARLAGHTGERTEINAVINANDVPGLCRWKGTRKQGKGQETGRGKSDGLFQTTVFGAKR